MSVSWDEGAYTVTVLIELVTCSILGCRGTVFERSVRVLGDIY